MHRREPTSISISRRVFLATSRGPLWYLGTWVATADADPADDVRSRPGTMRAAVLLYYI